jgi:predicted RNase H-like HicB family nuclease
MAHYYAIAERGQGTTWWISFPDGPGIYSAADDAGEIVAQAQDALASVLMHPPADLPRSIEDGAQPPADLSDFEKPALVVVIPFKASVEAREAA